MEIKEVEGNIVLEKVSFTRMLKKNVIKNNSTSGKVQVPKELIGKTVYIVWSERGAD